MSLLVSLSLSYFITQTRVVMDTILLHRNANNLMEKQLIIVRTYCPVLHLLRKFISALLCSRCSYDLWILLGISCNILLVPSLISEVNGNVYIYYIFG
jgi:hypothetical protein